MNAFALQASVQMQPLNQRAHVRAHGHAEVLRSISMSQAALDGDRDPSEYLRMTNERTIAKDDLAPLTRNDFIPGARSVKPSQHDQLTEQARKLVAQTFFGAMLKQMRESPFKSDLFSGGRGGQAFGSVLDQHLADRMSRAAGEKLVRGIVRKFEASQARKKDSFAPSDASDTTETETSSKNPTGYDYSKVRIHVAPALRG